MMLKLSLARMFGAAMFFVAICAAPSMAYAHTGHAVPAVSTSTSSVDIDVRADVEAADVSVHMIPIFELRSGFAEQQPRCGGILCCGNAQCFACAFVIVGDTSIAVPYWASALPLSTVIIPGNGIGPQDLLKPPRFFV